MTINMKKNTLRLTLGFVIGLAAVIASADEARPPSAPAMSVGAALEAASPAGGEGNTCILKTDLPADMVAKCTEAMAKADKAMLEGCCQVAPPQGQP